MTDTRDYTKHCPNCGVPAGFYCRYPTECR